MYKAYAKINLHLKITGKRNDGYHNLETVFQEIPLYDELEIVSNNTKTITFSSSGIVIPACGMNLCEKAATLLQNQFNCSKGCDINLIKKIPIGAGLGGGSSDAATVLKVLNNIWLLNRSTNELEQLAATLGADVPFFIKGKTAYAEGIGDILTSIKPFLENYFLLLINPGIHINTQKAYRNLKINLTKKNNNCIFDFVSKYDRENVNLNSYFGNDFEDYVFASYKEIAKIKDILLEKGSILAKMSGSGSTVFGFFEKESQAMEAKMLFANLKDYYVKVLKV